MMQYSVYIKVLNAPTKRTYELKAIRQNLPPKGNVRFLTITNRQYYDIEMLRGNKRINETINTENRRVKIQNENKE